MINRVILLGRAGKDPEAYADGKLRIFGLATSRNYKDKEGEWQEKTEWHNIKCWQNLADYVNGRVVKGALVYVEGSIEESTYETEDGIKKVQYSIKADTVRVIQKPEEKAEQKNAPAPDKGDDLPF